MIELVIGAEDIENLRSKLTGESVEGCAILIASEVRRADGSVRLLVRQAQFPESRDYKRREKFRVELSPDFIARVTKKARREGQTLVFVHSHLGKEAPLFSLTDDEEKATFPHFLNVAIRIRLTLLSL